MQEGKDIALRDLKKLDIRQVVYIDLETTDLINRESKKFPHILELCALSCNGQEY